MQSIVLIRLKKEIMTISLATIAENKAIFPALAQMRKLMKDPSANVSIATKKVITPQIALNLKKKENQGIYHAITVTKKDMFLETALILEMAIPNQEEAEVAEEEEEAIKII